ncbi:hypothetical protein, partial [Brevibacillus agri]|uniref:hypothetical protein n=1 Tax=Brevibacillus agri TaxID=51101 RepID=UPI001EE54E1D
ARLVARLFKLSYDCLCFEMTEIAFYIVGIRFYMKKGVNISHPSACISVFPITASQLFSILLSVLNQLPAKKHNKFGDHSFSRHFPIHNSYIAKSFIAIS